MHTLGSHTLARAHLRRSHTQALHTPCTRTGVLRSCTHMHTARTHGGPQHMSRITRMPPSTPQGIRTLRPAPDAHIGLAHTCTCTLGLTHVHRCTHGPTPGPLTGPLPRLRPELGAGSHAHQPPKAHPTHKTWAPAPRAYHPHIPLPWAWPLPHPIITRPGPQPPSNTPHTPGTQPPHTHTRDTCPRLQPPCLPPPPSPALDSRPPTPHLHLS